MSFGLRDDVCARLIAGNIYVAVRQTHDMQVSVVRADQTAKPVLRRLLELNAHDFSAFDGRDVNEHGEYGYAYLDHYWTEPEDRRALLFRCDGLVAGFALLRKGPPHSVAEFFVLRKYRRRGVGAAAALLVLTTWPGEWTTHQVAGNDAAVAFWRFVIPAPFSEQVDIEGTTQRFRTGGQGRVARGNFTPGLPRNGA